MKEEKPVDDLAMEYALLIAKSRQKPLGNREARRAHQLHDAIYEKVGPVQAPAIIHQAVQTLKVIGLCPANPSTN